MEPVIGQGRPPIKLRSHIEGTLKASSCTVSLNKLDSFTDLVVGITTEIMPQRRDSKHVLTERLTKLESIQVESQLSVLPTTWKSLPKTLF